MQANIKSLWADTHNSVAAKSVLAVGVVLAAPVALCISGTCSAVYPTCLRWLLSQKECCADTVVTAHWQAY